MNSSNLDLLPHDIIIKVIENNRMTGEVKAYKKILATNFDYFDALLKFEGGVQNNVTYLNVGLNFRSVRLCYNLLAGKTAFKVKYDLIVGMLEVCNVLQCKSSFVDTLVLNLVDRLDNESIGVVEQFCKKLKTNDKLNASLVENIVLRLAYLIDPTVYFKERCHESDYYVTDRFVIMPKKKWLVQKNKCVGERRKKNKNFDDPIETSLYNNWTHPKNSDDPVEISFYNNWTHYYLSNNKPNSCVEGCSGPVISEGYYFYIMSKKSISNGTCVFGILMSTASNMFKIEIVGDVIPVLTSISGSSVTKTPLEITYYNNGDCLLTSECLGQASSECVNILTVTYMVNYNTNEYDSEDFDWGDYDKYVDHYFLGD